MTLQKVFNGPDYVHDRDSKRLSKQFDDIFQLMSDGEFRSLSEIEAHFDFKYPQSSISAQLRHMRKERFGSNKVNKKYLGNGLYKYQLEVNDGTF